MNEHAVLEGQIVDVVGKRIFHGRITVDNGVIARVEKIDGQGGPVILPGFVDAHVHIESSMLVPSEFARLAVPHGTVASISDPHEIANVLGVEGVEYMLENARHSPFKFYFGAPSCVPATPFERAGAVLGEAEVEQLLKRDDIYYLGEMMNFPGVVHDDPVVKAKLALARKYGKPVDGHAPGLRGAELEKYLQAGITTDHESLALDEAREKIQQGMKIIIREGSAAKNFKDMLPLLSEYPDMVMFCSDDKHPDDLVRGHIDRLVKAAIVSGVEPLAAIAAATVNPVRHYRLDVGLLQENDAADIIVADNLLDLNIQEVYIRGRLAARAGKTLLPHRPADAINIFNPVSVLSSSLGIRAEGAKARVIEIIPGQLLTKEVIAEPAVKDGYVVSDTGRDILKLAVLNRYEPAPPAVALVKGFGLQSGALASSVAHDSHNIVAVGTTDEEISRVINLVSKSRGGIAFVAGEEERIVPLPVAGLMSPDEGYSVAANYEKIEQEAKRLGSALPSPFMALSFLALLVIPELKLSDRGLFDGKKFEFVPLFV